MAAAFLFGDGYAKWHRLSGGAVLVVRTKIERPTGNGGHPLRGRAEPPRGIWGAQRETAGTVSTARTPAARPPQT